MTSVPFNQAATTADARTVTVRFQVADALSPGLLGAVTADPAAFSIGGLDTSPRVVAASATAQVDGGSVVLSGTLTLDAFTPIPAGSSATITAAAGAFTETGIGYMSAAVSGASIDTTLGPALHICERVERRIVGIMEAAGIFDRVDRFDLGGTQAPRHGEIVGLVDCSESDVEEGAVSPDALTRRVITATIDAEMAVPGDGTEQHLTLAHRVLTAMHKAILADHTLTEPSTNERLAIDVDVLGHEIAVAGDQTLIVQLAAAIHVDHDREDPTQGRNFTARATV